MSNVIDLTTGQRQQSDGTPIPIMLGGGLLRCSRCERTFTAETYHCITDLVETADGLLRCNDVCRRCAYADPVLSNWQNLCDLMDSIDRTMQDAADRDARGLLYQLITNATGHLAVWRWPNEEPPASVARRGAALDDDQADT
ncbi:hypothetical protein GCM10009527_009290 [Actinomadura nitritigenes]|uniref:Uncharacterized protein n=1 Tax=Actinomadura nitritigenes TaxID=134602 RepID=A0ABS3R2D6_9ACTN|nr:hypothetical protein [Actinomadura nitritigenes]MBO2439808.1 hypothetical protein [Actinomadura nitritigenes]